VTLASRIVCISFILSLLSAKTEAAGDDPAQNFARSAAQREGGHGLGEIAEHLLEVTARSDRRLHSENLVCLDRHVLLEAGAESLHHRGVARRVLALVEHASDRARHLPRRHELRNEAADFPRAVGSAALLQLTDHLDEKDEARKIALRPRSLESK